MSKCDLNSNLFVIYLYCSFIYNFKHFKNSLNPLKIFKRVKIFYDLVSLKDLFNILCFFETLLDYFFN